MMVWNPCRSIAHSLISVRAESEEDDNIEEGGNSSVKKKVQFNSMMALHANKCYY